MKSLIKEFNCKDRWYPMSVDCYRDYIKIDTSIKNSVQLKDNIAYNLQYLEYIQKQLDELKLSSVIYGMLCKTYVITGMGIVEGLFSNLLKSKGEWNYSEWKSKTVIKSNPCKIQGIHTKVHTEIFEKVDSFEMRMDLDSMIKRIEKKKLLSIEHSNFPTLKKLRNLRNRVHLQESNDRYDTDYHNFSRKEKTEMGQILNILLTDETFNNMPQYPNIYNFLLDDMINNK